VFRRNDRSADKSPAIVITSAQEALSQEQRGRQRRYFVSMMIRTACFISTIFLPNPYRWFAMAGAVFLPYIAVVIANAGRETIIGKTAIMNNQRRQIGNS
jgi:predicted tellurium resistance membrane protein TerC